MDLSKNPFKLRAQNGNYMLKGLFYETSSTRSREDFMPLYTLKEHDHTDKDGNVYKSAYRIYMECETDYEAAMAMVGSLVHWDKLKECKWFLDGMYSPCGKYKRYLGLTEWTEHRKMKQEAAATAQMIDSAEAGNVSAQKILFDDAKKANKAGRVGRKKKANSYQDPTQGADNEVLSNVFGIK